jgi:hypothetical protein
MKMMMFKAGDKVAVLDDSFSGTVKATRNGMVSIETPEGFVLEYKESELVKVAAADDIRAHVTGRSISSVIREKETAKRKRPAVREKRKKNEFVLEVDLHIEKLVKSKNGMSNYDILTIQTETARRQLDFAIDKRFPRVVFIHGVGEGVLKAELDFLFSRYDNIVFGDADYQKYGLGATEVYIRQNPNRL